MSCKREPVAATSVCFAGIRSYKLVTLPHTWTILIVCLQTSSLHRKCYTLLLRIDNSRQGVIRGKLLSSAVILSTVSYYTLN